MLIRTARAPLDRVAWYAHTRNIRLPSVSDFSALELLYCESEEVGMEKFKPTELPDIPACPHHPADFKFPKRAFGKAMRSCQAS